MSGVASGSLRTQLRTRVQSSGDGSAVVERHISVNRPALIAVNTRTTAASAIFDAPPALTDRRTPDAGRRRLTRHPRDRDSQ